jgi:hypothetical protein
LSPDLGVDGFLIWLPSCRVAGFLIWPPPVLLAYQYDSWLLVAGCADLDVINSDQPRWP